MSSDLDQPYLLSFQVGVNLAINAIRNAYLVVDGPNCVIFRTSQIQGNHDWQADLLRDSSFHRVSDTDCTTERAAVGDDRILRQRLREVDAQPDCDLIVLSAMSPVAVTGRQYDQIVAELKSDLTAPVVTVPCGSLIGDWLHGYAWSLRSLAAQLPLPHAGPKKKEAIALVGYLRDRREADHEANLRHLGELLAGMGLELVSCWLDAGPAARLGRVAEAGTIVSLPYAREAGRILAERTGADLLETGLPLGLEGTCRWLRQIGEQLDRGREAERVIDSQLSLVVPRLQWVLPHAVQGKRVAIIGDPHLAFGLGQALEELGARVALLAYWADASHVEDAERDAVARLLVNPQKDELNQAIKAEILGAGLDLIFTNSHALEVHVHQGHPQPPAFVELGFPAYYSHALFDRPFLGFSGTLVLVERMVNALSQAEVRRSNQQGE